MSDTQLEKIRTEKKKTQSDSREIKIETQRDQQREKQPTGKQPPCWPGLVAAGVLCVLVVGGGGLLWRLDDDGPVILAAGFSC